MFSDESESVVLDEDSLVAAKEASERLGRAQFVQEADSTTETKVTKPSEVLSVEPTKRIKRNKVEDEESKGDEDLRGFDLHFCFDFFLKNWTNF